MPTASEQEVLDSVLDPVLFAERILGHTLWDTPKEILRALDKPGARVAVKACHSSGKTFTAGEAVPWFMTRYKDSIVPTTAPTWRQVKDLLWKEIHTAVAKAKVKYPKMNQTDWYFSPDHYAVGVSTTEAERFQGFHAPHVLIIIDEAPGVADAIFEAIEGIEAGGDVRILMLGNPTITSGRFYNAFSNRRSAWTTFTIDAFDTPNMEGVTMDDLLRWERDGNPELYANPMPYLTTRQWILDRYHEWGENSPLWQARVRGQFPRQSNTSLISLSDIERARYNVRKQGGSAMGVDVARYGADDTAHAHLDGNALIRLTRKHGRSTTDTAGDIKQEVRRDPSLVVVVDDSGVGGGVVDSLLADNVPVIPFNAGNEPMHNADVLNRGSEAYWSLAKAFEDGDVVFDEELPPELVDDLVQQLVGIEYKFDARQRIQVKKRGLKDELPSPDLADSLVMAWEARRIETNSPALTSLQMEPARIDGYSIRDKPRLLQSAAADPGGIASGTLGWGGRAPMGLTGQSVPPSTDTVHIFCPSCNQLARLREKGRVDNLRNFDLICKCGYKQLIQQEVGKVSAGNNT